MSEPDPTPTPQPSRGGGEADVLGTHAFPGLQADDVLVASVLRWLHEPIKSPRTYYVPMWSAVAHVFAVGSTHAHGICRRFGYDPDEPVRLRRYVGRSYT